MIIWHVVWVIRRHSVCQEYAGDTHKIDTSHTNTHHIMITQTGDGTPYVCVRVRCIFYLSAFMIHWNHVVVG